MTERYDIIAGYDMHLHFRWDNRTKVAIPPTVRQFSGGLIMPNTVEERPIRNSADVKDYLAFLHQQGLPRHFRACMTLYFTDYITPEDIKGACEEVVAVKAYPQHGTTGSHLGTNRLMDPKYDPVLLAMQERDMVLCIHGEDPDPHIAPWDAEEAYLPMLEFLVQRYPRLRIVLEHVTTKEALKLVYKLSRKHRVACTVTAHHMMFNARHVYGNRLQTDLHCMPCIKGEADRKALISAAIEAEEWCLFGSDSAPHERGSKYAAECCAGVFSAPVLLPALVNLFEHEVGGSWQGRLERFICANAMRFYELPSPGRQITLTRQNWTVPEVYEDGDTCVTPMYAGKTLPFSIVETPEA